VKVEKFKKIEKKIGKNKELLKKKYMKNSLELFEDKLNSNIFNNLVSV